MANLRSKCDRAVAAYITPIVVAADSTCAVFVANDSRTRTLPLVDVITSQGPEDPPFSGIHQMTCRVRVEYPAGLQPDQVGTDANRLALDAMVEAVFDALHQTDTGSDYRATAVLINTAGNALATSDPTNHADMDDFTCLQFLGVSYLGAPSEGGDSSTFIEVMQFTMACAPKGGLF